ncbi:endoplasmic reticulum-Golgi intermediate compartment protein 2 [Latimeria chalumnae]|uniref:endoplasmic reticulum-Golgi intermediate compartment protein 2 n=1 Tax=Latimeria chalumnae TaxID=7897 RepID=UPI0003C14A34|nr:PREDICTED: endoplasmic reticulum-Golgi intermediate compartment protein 2-like [Latimeria chalumnae]|eukprot:XP_006004395.1 PREDICTED: endoplasmic reticulum-Golgi intermediate compartment protein 2-like [Latimeria chalumnae]
MRRRVSRKPSVNLFREFDGFPKVRESCVETSARGGTVSLLALTLISILSIGEFFHFKESYIKYEYAVDTDLTGKLKINVDVTVAMKCEYIGADALDSAEKMVAGSDDLQFETAYFDLSPNQKAWQRRLQNIHEAVQKEQNLLNSLIKSSFNGTVNEMPKREVESTSSHNACRIHGSIFVNKIAGNFHITLGRSFALPAAHAHLSSKISQTEYNFSHRIDHFSFGGGMPYLLNPLDGSEKVTHENLQMYQYFLVVVPTKVNTAKFFTDTHQYSVTDRGKVIQNSKNNHDIPGIFMKYDLSSFTVRISEERMPVGQFLTRLCGIVGGIFSTAGIIHNVCGFIVGFLFCQSKSEDNKPSSPSSHKDKENHFLPEENSSN